MYCDVSLQDMDTSSSSSSIPVGAKGNKGLMGSKEAPRATANAAKGVAAGAGAGAALFWKDEFKSKTKTVLINLLTEYLKKMNENAESGVNTPPPEGWIKSENCKHLANKRKEANRSFERKKNFFESCGTNIAKRDS